MKFIKSNKNGDVKCASDK
jgi:hypothetical protein